ncbi:hypothetical protein HK099_001872 [Clydaea vesicula]|uniref:Myb-like domain-containing protein n=1 Tax=Clydaea vesicula TaxID=447962 RepID=A0AAD5U3F3_9FUNG|nr:hypothetical protein HK099_001872 [Clydaea vesicula]
MTETTTQRKTRSQTQEDKNPNPKLSPKKTITAVRKRGKKFELQEENELNNPILEPIAPRIKKKQKTYDSVEMIEDSVNTIIYQGSEGHTIMSILNNGQLSPRLRARLDQYLEKLTKTVCEAVGIDTTGAELKGEPDPNDRIAIETDEIYQSIKQQELDSSKYSTLTKFFELMELVQSAEELFTFAETDDNSKHREADIKTQELERALKILEGLALITDNLEDEGYFRATADLLTLICISKKFSLSEAEAMKEALKLFSSEITSATDHQKIAIVSRRQSEFAQNVKTLTTNFSFEDLSNNLVISVRSMLVDVLGFDDFDHNIHAPKAFFTHQTAQLNAEEELQLMEVTSNLLNTPSESLSHLRHTQQKGKGRAKQHEFDNSTDSQQSQNPFGRLPQAPQLFNAESIHQYQYYQHPFSDTNNQFLGYGMYQDPTMLQNATYLNQTPRNYGEGDSFTDSPTARTTARRQGRNGDVGVNGLDDSGDLSDIEEDQIVIPDYQTRQLEPPKKNSAGRGHGAWTPEQIRVLEKAIRKHGTHWAEIERNYRLQLGNRGQLSIKDKARNEIKRRTNNSLPLGFFHKALSSRHLSPFSAVNQGRAGSQTVNTASPLSNNMVSQEHEDEDDNV